MIYIAHLTTLGTSTISLCSIGSVVALERPNNQSNQLPVSLLVVLQHIHPHTHTSINHIFLTFAYKNTFSLPSNTIFQRVATS